MARVARKKRIAFAIALILILTGSAEIVLRVYDFSFYVNFGADVLGMPLLDLHRLRRIQNRTVDFDPHLFWKFKPNQTLDAHGVYLKPVHINSRGFRGPDFQEQKPANTLRIVCIGDSTTFGWSVGDDQTYAAKLSEILEPLCATKKVEVLNLGVTGYTSLQGRELMIRQVKKMRPDMVVFAFGPNDRLPAINSDQDHIEKGTWAVSKLQVTLHRLSVYKLLKAGVIYLKNRARGLSLDPKTYIPHLKRKVSPEQYANNVRTVKAACDEIGAGLILVHVDYPSLPVDHIDREIKKQAGEHGARMPGDWKTWDGAALHQSLSRELDVSTIEMRSVFTNSLKMIQRGELMPQRARALKSAMPELIEAEPWRLLMIDNGHPSEWGHELIALEIKKKLLLFPRFAGNCREELNP